MKSISYQRKSLTAYTNIYVAFRLCTVGSHPIYATAKAMYVFCNKVTNGTGKDNSQLVSYYFKSRVRKLNVSSRRHVKIKHE